MRRHGNGTGGGLPFDSAWRPTRRALVLSSGAALLLSVVMTTGAAAQLTATAGVAAREGQQVVVITGSTDGLGREVATRLGASGAHIVVHGRNLDRGREVVAEINAGGAGTARFYAADLASLDEVRALGNAILRDYERIDVLINNAGIGSTAPERQVSSDGHELRFAVNYLSGFLLTRMLLPVIVESAPSRIVNVASAAQNPIDFNDVMLENGYDGGRAYGQSKLAQILFTMDLAEELEGRNVIVSALHPATFMNTTMVLSSGRTPMSTVEEGADAVMNLVTTAGLASGQYFNGQRAVRANEQAYDVEARARLRALSRQLTGLD